jgi:hypothetical protein
MDILFQHQNVERMDGSRETILLVAVLVLAVSNLVLLAMLYSYTGRGRTATTPVVEERNASQARCFTEANVTSASTALNVSEGGRIENKTATFPPVNRTAQYVFTPLAYFLKLEAISGPDSNLSAAPLIPENLAVQVLYLDRSRYPTMCEVTMRAKMEMGAAFLNVTLPLPGGKCYRVDPVLVSRASTEVYYRLALVEDPEGACGYCVMFTVKIFYLPPGHYMVTIGPIPQYRE